MNMYKRVQRAVESGDLVKAERCELCGSSKMLLAHHWHGYTDEHALNVWWVCHKCNTALSGPAYHNGSVSMEQAQKIIQDRIRQ